MEQRKRLPSFNFKRAEYIRSLNSKPNEEQIISLNEPTLGKKIQILIEFKVLPDLNAGTMLCCSFNNYFQTYPLLEKKMAIKVPEELHNEEITCRIDIWSNSNYDFSGQIFSDSH